MNQIRKTVITLLTPQLFQRKPTGEGRKEEEERIKLAQWDLGHLITYSPTSSYEALEHNHQQCHAKQNRPQAIHHCLQESKHLHDELVKPGKCCQTKRPTDDGLIDLAHE